MATISARTGSGLPNVGNLSAAQAGNGTSTNIIDRGRSQDHALLTITTAVGASPTCTYAVQGSADGTNWFPVQWSDAAAPDTWSVATFTITAAGTTHRFVRGSTPVRYLRLVYSANTNVTNTADLHVF